MNAPETSYGPFQKVGILGGKVGILVEKVGILVEKVGILVETSFGVKNSTVTAGLSSPRSKVDSERRSRRQDRFVRSSVKYERVALRGTATRRSGVGDRERAYARRGNDTRTYVRSSESRALTSEERPRVIGRGAARRPVRDRLSGEPTYVRASSPRRVGPFTKASPAPRTKGRA